MTEPSPFLLDDSVFPVPYYTGASPPLALAKPDAVAFISSRLEEMREERELAASVCSRLGIDRVTWEERLGRAQSRPPVDAYLDGVRQSDILIGLYGLETSAEVESEYVEARSQGVDVLAFVRDTRAHETRAPELEDFLAGLRQERAVTYEQYSDQSDLESKLTESLDMLIEKRGRLWLKLASVVLSPNLVREDGHVVFVDGFTHSCVVESALRGFRDTADLIGVTALSWGETRIGRVTTLQITRASRFRCDYSMRIDLKPRSPRTPYNPKLETVALCEVADGVFDLALAAGSPAMVRGLDCFRQGVLVTLLTEKGERLFNRGFGSNFRELFGYDRLDSWKLDLLLHIDTIETLTMPIQQSDLGRVAPAKREVERVVSFELEDLDRRTGSCKAVIDLRVNGLPEPVHVILPLRGLRNASAGGGCVSDFNSRIDGASRLRLPD